MENYSFLGWLNSFLKLRNDTRSNLKNDDDNIDSSSNEEDEKDEVPAISDDDTDRMSDAESNASELSVKRKTSPSMTSPKESSSRNPKWCQVVIQARRKSKKKIPPNRINKCLQEKSTIFSEKVKKGEDEIFGDVVASELKSLSCSILRVKFKTFKFKHEVNNLIFKYQMLNLQQNAQPNPPIQSPPSTFELTTPPSQSNGAVFMQNTNGRSFDCYNTSMSSNQWNS